VPRCCRPRENNQRLTRTRRDHRDDRHPGLHREPGEAGTAVEADLVAVPPVLARVLVASREDHDALPLRESREGSLGTRPPGARTLEELTDPQPPGQLVHQERHRTFLCQAVEGRE